MKYNIYVSQHIIQAHLYRISKFSKTSKIEFYFIEIPGIWRMIAMVVSGIVDHEGKLKFQRKRNEICRDYIVICSCI